MIPITVQEVEGTSLRAAANAIYRNGHNPLLAMFANDERSINNYYAIYCLFAIREGSAHSLKLVKGKLAGDGLLEFPSLVPVIPAAAWYEREICDLFGLVPTGHPDLRPLVLHENWPRGLYPLRKDFSIEQIATAQSEYPVPHVSGEGVYEVPVGPIHAGIIEPGHFRFSQAGENIISLEAKLFFTHRGIEKAVEGLDVEAALFHAERICGACSVSHAISYSQAVEAIASVTVPRRARYIRMLAAELERLYNHIGDIGNLCAGVGFAVGISHGARLKEYLMRLNEAVAGNRFLRGIIVPGGVAMDIPGVIAREISTELANLEREFKELVQLLKNNEAFRNRIETTGILPEYAALDLGVVGVAARASGVNTDMRRDFPYACYDELGFQVPVYHTGDVAARLWVRADEAKESLAMSREILDVLADDATGTLRIAIPPLAPYQSGMGWSESARGGNVHWLMVGAENRIYRYFVRSASYPNWPALTVASPGNIIPDFPLINKSFELCYACLDR